MIAVYALVYVDDVIVMAETMNAVTLAKKCIAGMFAAKDQGEIEHFLRITVTRNRSTRKLSLTQRQAILEFLREHEIPTTSKRTSPLSKGDVPANDGQVDLERCTMLQQIIGKLLYLSKKTRPDIAAAVGLLSRHNSNASDTHLQLAHQILSYLNGTLDYALILGGGEIDKLIAFSDSDWAGDKEDSKSTSGYAIFLGSGLISWYSGKQECVSGSTAEAEYVAASECSNELIWFIRLLKSIGHDLSVAHLHCDNDPAISFAKNRRQGRRTRHIDVRYHVVRQYLQDGFFTISYVPSKKNRADIFTKTLDRNSHHNQTQGLGLLPISRMDYKGINGKGGVLNVSRLTQHGDPC